MPEPGAPPSPINLQAILKMLQGGGMAMPGGGGGSPNPVISPGMPGQIPAMPGVPQVAGAGAIPGQQGAAPSGLPARPAGPIGQPPQGGGRGPSPGPVENSLFQTGFEFNTPQGRNAAVTSSAIKGVTDFISQAKQKKESKTRAQAENYMSQVVAAQQSGDQEALNMLLQDPKVISTLEKGLDYYMPKVPGEPPPPEATGVRKFLDKLTGKQPGATDPRGPRLPAPNTPGGVSMPRMPQSAASQQQAQDITSAAALKALQSDPTMARAQGLGTTMSGQEMAQSERWQSGFGLSPVQQSQMEANDKKLLQSWEMFKTENETEMKKLASQERLSSARDKTELEAARIHVGPLYERAKMAQEMQKAQLEYKKALASGGQGKANQIAMKTLTDQLDNLRTNREKALKDGNQELADQWGKDAEKLQKTYDEIQASQSLDIDSIIKSVLAD